MKKLTALTLNVITFTILAFAFGVPAALFVEVIALPLSLGFVAPEKAAAFAKIKFGMVVVAGSGKLGGHVLAKNRGGAYARTKVTPLNPQTTYQANARFNLTQWSKAWSGTLTQAQRDAWNAAVSAFARTDVFGDLRNPDGKNLYTRLNINLYNVGAAAITAPPVPPSLSEITGLTVAPTAPGTVSITWTSGAVPASEEWLLEATKQVNAGKTFVKNLYRVIGVIAHSSTSPFAAGTDYTTKFGAMTSGQRISIRITQIDNTTGVNGVPITATALIV